MATITTTKEYEFIYDLNHKCIYNVKLQYEEINKEDKYQTKIYLPYLIQSSLTTTSYTDKLDERALSVLNSSLKSKYNSIKLRAYNNSKRYEAFKEIVKDCNLTNDESKIAYSNGLYHQEKIGDKSTKAIWKELKINFQNETSLSKIDKNFKFELSWKKFVKMMVLDNCEYCGISMENIYDLAENHKLFTKRSRGYSLEIDQKDAFANYSDNNCVACCYWCNNAKTDEFQDEEFKNIAKGLNHIWKKRDAKIIDFNEISFWQKEKL